ncbi:hypothetical protein GmRootV213_18190 [Variovorax sp. V213]|uniref:hypothetical protein n=1 Tax=Variovorax sp. V213 TaxID=3065955 RepID=UPI0034E87AAE
MADEDIVVEGMQLLLQQVEGEVARAEADHQRLVEAVTLARARVDALLAKRHKIVAALSAKALIELQPTSPSTPPISAATAAAILIGRPMLFGGGPPTSSPMQQVFQSRRAWRADVIRRIENLLRPGRPLATKAIFDELSAQNVDFSGIKNPLHRLVQIMSETPHLHSDRKLGWSLASAPFPSIDNAALAPTAQQDLAENDVPQKGDDDEL